ncbi:ABC transporter ATP-binding protein [Polynucleobacter sp. 15G-AUS-farblos]|uniref:ABC transporter ATP-binding protein n=1 Tax=Polynucleobacter sp. 15G-AUS-farblos TaxID=2689094 RepID=UPI001C0CBCD1|nr:ABC transporter ATP-binding protein [Polynucleobacter sp. 15G-AUS-farblos]
MKSIIKVEGLSKKYILDHQGHAPYISLREAISGALKGVSKKLVPGSQGVVCSKEDFWALNDVSFDVQQGDRLGIIGRNGAGKSTLLKIISRITEPTKGRISISGRIASLLEVGTGFHPELTGRENIYLNGAILGMTKAEITRKFDEIVAFAEVEKFLDTPVKRYSSGMYVRLAFAVAAHLEPEVLIIDEVLAVGDLQFQKKCLGKMGEAAKEGKTVILVSHNMQTILNLSSKAMLLESGKIVEYGDPHKVVARFQDGFNQDVFGRSNLSKVERYGDGRAEFTSIEITPYDEFGNKLISPIVGCNLEIVLSIAPKCDLANITAAITFYDDLGSRLIDLNTLIKGVSVDISKDQIYKIKFIAKNIRLKPDIYTIGLWLGRLNEADIDGIRYSTSFRLDARREDILYASPFPGIYSCEFDVSALT